MTTHTDRIRQMAQEATYYADAMDGSGQMAGRIWSEVRDEHFAQLVAEDCAKVCAAMLEGCHDRSEYDAYSPDDAQTIGWVDALNESQKRIRARYSLKD